MPDDMIKTSRRGSLLRRLSPELVAEFWANVDKSGDCWMWRGRRGNQFGHGGCNVPGYGNTFAHRIAYTLACGEIPTGMLVCHRCDVPGCVNPAHLFVGSYSDNMRDAWSKGRMRPARGRTNHALHMVACRWPKLDAEHFACGHPRTAENTAKANTRPRCRECYNRLNAVSCARRRARQRALAA